MPSTFLGLQIGHSGLLAAQAGLNITGQNISNADTDGYSRQRVSTSAIDPVGYGYIINQITPGTNVGQGVSVTNISQIRSAYLDEQFRSQYADFCKSESMTQGLRYLENLFRELDDDTSLTISISDFFDALSDFADDPTSEAARTTVQQTALSMTENFRLIYKEMLDLYNDQNASVKTVASQINQVAKEIAALNEAISQYEVSGETANDLRDKRNLLLDKLSGYAEITLSENGSMVDVRIAGETLG
ncbi:MAG: flagellar hook-associated protein FlgK, partial [Clostridiales bacterium]|nr:flagellar hook-associated protein FlgK [Clostridiales bacterium]